jgi:NAD(P)-dependent dehydrogenase (short-subunit alcohol dehydrogenase family)
LGLEITKIALKHGKKVIATSRNASRLSGLKSLGATTISLNVNRTPAEIDAAVAEAGKVHGTINILVNNAAHILIGGIEEARYVFPDPSHLFCHQLDSNNEW